MSRDSVLLTVHYLFPHQSHSLVAKLEALRCIVHREDRHSVYLALVSQLMINKMVNNAQLKLVRKQQ